jgi:serine/threonine protein kinase
MSLSTSTTQCPSCGAELPANAPQDLCPKCLLLGVAALTETGIPLEHRPSPPSLDAVQAAFTQLEIVELIGQGGMGAVYKARQSKLNRFVALKILPEAMARDPAFAERFAREGQMLARLNHPNIVTIHDFGQAGGFFYLLMEYVDGVNLRQAMQAGRFTPEQALAIVPMICEALQYAHDEGVLHRDIKPENILLDTKGRVRLVDFGIAKLAAGADVAPSASDPASSPHVALTQACSALGTLNYMAPEQRVGPSTVDQRADIYSLGVVFYEMLTGELPVGRFALPSRKTPMDPRVDDVVMRALAKQKEKRFRSADEVKTCVEAITATAPADQKRLWSIPAAAHSYPIPLSPRFRTLQLIGLLVFLGLMLHEIAPSFRFLPNLWFTMRADWVQAFVTITGVGVISWLGVMVWRRRYWLLAPFPIGTLSFGSPDDPHPSTTYGTGGWLSMTWVGVILVLLVEVVWILLGNVTLLAQGIATKSVLKTVYFLVPPVLAILLVILLVRREVRRKDVRVPVAPPSWMPRAALLGVGFALVMGLAELQRDVWVVSILYSEFIAITSLAFLTRSRIWRAIALACLIWIVGDAVISLTFFFIVSIRGQLPVEWSYKVGAVNAMTFAIMQQCICLICYLIGLIALLLPTTRAAFGIGKAANESTPLP